MLLSGRARFPCHILTFTTHVRKEFCLVQSYIEATCAGYDAFVSQDPRPLEANIHTCDLEASPWPLYGTMPDAFAHPTPGI